MKKEETIMTWSAVFMILGISTLVFMTGLLLYCIHFEL